MQVAVLYSSPFFSFLLVSADCIEAPVGNELDANTWTVLTSFASVLRADQDTLCGSPVHHTIQILSLLLGIVFFSSIGLLGLKLRALIATDSLHDPEVKIDLGFS